MARRPKQDATVGALFALALIIFALAMMAVGGESGLLFKQTPFSIVFPNASGLLVGAPVRMDGVQIGTVSEIRLPTDPAESGIEVQVGINPDYAPRVRGDSRAALRILQFLTNEKYVEIVAGSLDSLPLEPDSRILRLVEVGVVERGEAIAESLGEILVSLKNILGPLERGEGLIGQMLHDTEVGKSGFEALSGTMENLDRLTGDLVEGKGTLGRLIYDEELAGKLDDFALAIDRFSELARAVDEGEGLIGDLFDDEGATRRAVADLSASAASFRRLVEGLENQDGLIGRLTTDEEYAARLADDLERLLSGAAEIMEKINAGEGTLGALINDQALYDGAEDVFTGVNDSKFARWLTRHYRKKGVKARDLAEQEAAATGDSASDP